MDNIELLAEYPKIKISVECGEKTGSVFTFIHKKHINSRMIAAYKSELKRRLEEQKFMDGYYIFHCDPGPTIATANFFEFGGYEQLIYLLSKDCNDSLIGLECVLEVVENDETHHIMLKKDEQNFYNIEQVALIKYSLNRHCRKYADYNKRVYHWIEENAEKFEKLINGLKVNKIEGNDYIYRKCTIYKNVFKTIKKAFEFDEKEMENYGKMPAMTLTQ